MEIYVNLIVLHYYSSCKKAIEVHIVIETYIQTNPQLQSEKIIEALREDLHLNLHFHADFSSKLNTTYRILKDYIVIYGIAYTMYPSTRRIIHGLVNMISTKKRKSSKAFHC